MKLINYNEDLSGIDCHLHSAFSPDAKRMGADAPQQIADAVRQKGLNGFIITDHLDYGRWDGYVPDLDRYFEVWEKVRRDNPDLKIYIGLEVGFELCSAADSARLICDYPFEYIINSVHYWGDPDYFKEWNYGRRRAYTHYLECVIASLDAPYPFTTIGHLGFPERYAPYGDENDCAMRYDMFKPLLDIIIEKAIEKKIRFEENTNSGGNFRLPRKEFLQAYKAAGGIRPALGSDAHVSAAIAQYFDAANAFLDEIFD